MRAPATKATPPTMGLSTTVWGRLTSTTKNPTSAARSVGENVKLEIARATMPRTILLSYAVTATSTTRHKRAYAGCPGTEETTVLLVVEVQRNEVTIQEKKRELGWQVYATNDLTRGLPHVVWAYRGQYRIENDWSRLKGRPLGLTPIYLQDEQRIQGLVYLLSLALRILTLTEWVRRSGGSKDGDSQR